MRLKSLAFILNAVLLTGCVAAFVAGGAAVAGLVYDRRSVNTLATDTRLFHIMHRDVLMDPRFRGSRIVVVPFNRVILLVGETSSMALKHLARQRALAIPGVERVYDELRLGPPLPLTERSKDTWISSQIRTMMLATKDLESGSIRIVTEGGVVYLMGIVSPSQSDLAVDVARRINGVAQVVKLFKYVR